MAWIHVLSNVGNGTSLHALDMGLLPHSRWPSLHSNLLVGRCLLLTLTPGSCETRLIQVTVGCGKVCLFYVGGCAEFTTQDGGVPRWEFFIGDRPHHPEPDKHGRRPPIAQVQTNLLNCGKACFCVTPGNNGQPAMDL